MTGAQGPPRDIRGLEGPENRENGPGLEYRGAGVGIGILYGENGLDLVVNTYFYDIWQWL